jgi:16S rRNA (guanine527-N7)-methyltransferase
VIACALGETPGTRAHLVESIGKKCAFLSEAVRRTSAPALVHHARIEDFVREHPAPLDVVTARAVAPLDRLLGLAAPLLKIGALGLFPKGQDVGAELTAASKYWRIKAEIVPSLTAPSSGIVVVHSLERRSPR